MRYSFGPVPLEFLLARYAEDEAAARVAECEAKRRIVELHQPVKPMFGPPVCMCEGRDPGPTLAALALPYSDHEDYLQEWKP
jgi:hypothetical protein